MQKKVGNYLRKSSWGQQKRYVEPPKEENTWRGRPGGGMKRSRRDIGEVNVIKDQIGEMLTDEVKIKERWREYFSNLPNVENAKE